MQLWSPFMPSNPLECRKKVNYFLVFQKKAAGTSLPP